MIEIKLSQGAKPGLGGILPAAKVTAEIALTRGIPMGVDCISPAGAQRLLDAAGDDGVHRRAARAVGGQAGRIQALHRPCRGSSWAWSRRCCETGILPDFIVVDGAEGGTGASPLEFCRPCRHADARGPAVRPQHAASAPACAARSGSARRARSSAAFDIAAAMALGADWTNAGARLHVRAGLHPVADLPHQPMPDGGGDPGPDARARAGRRRQGERVSIISTATP